MKSLDQISVEKGTGKGSLQQNYTLIYDLLFTPVRDKPITLLEMGVQFGYSMEMWREYFPHATLIGMDCVDNGARGDWHFVMGDQSLAADLNELLPFAPFDIIVDDACHNELEVAAAFRYLSPRLKPGGYYCIEDLHRGMLLSIFRDQISEQDWLTQWESFTIYSSGNQWNLGVIRKKGP